MRIAIVGGGVAGLVAAHRLHPRHDITLFEADARIGGHVHTWTVPSGGRDWRVDTGFIVCNERNYPNFLSLMEELGVRTLPSTMSFSVRHDGANLEYNGSSLRQLFAQPANALRPRYLRMLAEVVRFSREARAAVERGGDGLSLGGLLAGGGYSAAFRDWYLVPMGSAIWSLPAARVLDMPARFFVEFFYNHGMLEVKGRPVWRVVEGGSYAYVEKIIAPFRDRIRLHHPVRRVTRQADHVNVDGESFDRVVLACHSDQALAMLADASPAEREILGALPYQANDVVLHTDSGQLPRRRLAWGSWNYRITGRPADPAVVTYNMNMLQNLRAPDTFCVTLNAAQEIHPGKVLGRVSYHHPVVTRQGAVARTRREEISGHNRTHFCGAYWGNGFHEDGVSSGLAVAGEIDGECRRGAGDE
jgi:predicted NAD/FAD-binding protein